MNAQMRQKFLGRDLRVIRREGFYNQHLDSELLKARRLRLHVHDQGRGIIRPKQHTWMGRKREHRRDSAATPGRLYGCLNHAAVTEVYTVKHPNGKVHGSRRKRRVGEAGGLHHGVHNAILGTTSRGCSKCFSSSGNVSALI
jgi:hypothetical protein